MFSSLPPVSVLSHRARRPILGLVAIVAVASMGPASVPGLVSVADGDLPVSPGDRVLQAVNVEVAPDGALTAVQGTTVTTGADGTESDSTSQAYAPQDVVSDLPVRVLTSYRTKDGSGSDLADLEGFTGRVQIDLTVENLTVRSEQLSYDVSGASRTRPALVGAPMTITAAADLGSIAPSTVVTKRSGSEEVTNGVLSKGADGATQVQWATILAPPQLSSVATLSLVVDATDFHTPAFDLSVQPGLVTDPSVGALVEKAFNPVGSEESKLQADTIETIGDVNDVLALAGDSITEVRTSLNSSTKTLGTTTVADLQSGIVQIAASMRTLDGTAKGLGQQISSALKSTGSSSLAQLDQTVSSIDALLGDTSQKPGTAQVRGDGCNTTVTTSRGGGSVYASLIRVAGTLDGYAQASGQCKTALQARLLNAIGPSADVVAQQCDPSTRTDPNPLADSVTCALSRTQSELPAKIAKTLEVSRTAVLDSLDTTGSQQLIAKVTATGSALDLVISRLPALRTVVPGGQAVDLGAVRTALDDVVASRKGFVSAVGGVRARANTELGTLQALRASQQSMFVELCGLLGEPAVTPERPLTRTQVDSLTGYLTTTTCPADGAAVVDPIANAANDSAVAAWQFVLDQTDPVGAGSPLKIALDGFDAKIASADEALRAARAKVDSNGTVTVQLRELFRQLGDLETSSRDVTDALKVLVDSQETAKGAINDAFTAAESSAQGDVEQSTQSSLERVSRQSIQARAQVDDAFTRSQVGMQRAAAEIVGDGRATINEQRAKLNQSTKQASGQIQSNVRSGLSTIADTVSASTRNTAAAGRLLRADLTKVLLDLGDPAVDGAGLLGTLSADAGSSRAADYQLAVASRTASSYANARTQDVGGIALRQAQAEAAFRRQAKLPGFQVGIPAGVEHSTIYTFHLAAGQ